MKTFITLLFMTFLFLTPLSYAESATPNKQATITLYEQPDSKSKVLGTIVPGTTLIPFFSQDHWLKVGDPTNGQVGWIDNATLPAQDRVFIKSIKNINSPDQGYQVTQYSGTTQIDEQQMKELVQNLQNRQAELQQMFNQMFNQSVVNFNVLLRQLNQETSKPWVAPVQQPVIVTPEMKSNATQAQPDNTVAPS